MGWNGDDSTSHDRHSGRIMIVNGLAYDTPLARAGLIGSSTSGGQCGEEPSGRGGWGFWWSGPVLDVG